MNTKTSLKASIALAACSFAIASLAADSNEMILQLTPAGKFQPSDGRKMKVPFWYIDQAVASAVIDRFNTRNQPVVVDYEHQTLHKEENGQPAPAAAWMRELIWKDGVGLFARVELTAKARKAIEEKEYLYFSPVFTFDPITGEVRAIEMGAITNTPALHGMSALEVRAAATFNLTAIEQEDESMKKSLLGVVIAALSLGATTTEEEAIVALNSHFEKDPLSNIRAALGTDDKADESALVAACTALKTKNPDPANYVPVAVMNGVKEQLAVATQKLKERDEADVDSSITAALADGRLLPAQETWARDLGKSNSAALNSFLSTATPIAALNNSQTKGKPPVKDDESGLTEDELAVCSRMGITPDEFKKSKSA